MRRSRVRWKSRGKGQDAKHGNKRVTHDGIEFRSGMEGRRYLQLKQLQAAGAISELEWQIKFPFRVNGILIATYTADFTYLEGGEFIVEDVKGYPNDRWPMKKKLMLAIYGIKIREVKKC